MDARALLNPPSLSLPSLRFHISRRSTHFAPSTALHIFSAHSDSALQCSRQHALQAATSATRLHSCNGKPLSTLLLAARPQRP